MNKRDYVNFRAATDTKTALDKHAVRTRVKPGTAARYLVEDGLRKIGLLKRKED